MEKDRCTRIAELLLLENEALKLESAGSKIFNFREMVYDGLDYISSQKHDLTPIEKVMYAILERISSLAEYGYGGGFEITFKPQVKIEQYTVDFLVGADFSDDKIVIECDGHDFHEKTKEQAKHDKERDRFLTAHGFKILRYTGSEIYNGFFKIEKELQNYILPDSNKCLLGRRKDVQ